MKSPFRLRWLEGWIFQVVFMGPQMQIEAHGFGICLRKSLSPGESLHMAADSLILTENERRRSIYRAWIRSNTSPIPLETYQIFD